MKVANDHYYEYLCHKCLYYKHGFPVISDEGFDMFEKEYESLYGHMPSSSICLDMCDWEPLASRTARKIDNLPLSTVKESAMTLMKKRLKKS